jgi:hypothetical protein
MSLSSSLVKRNRDKFFPRLGDLKGRVATQIDKMVELKLHYRLKEQLKQGSDLHLHCP